MRKVNQEVLIYMDALIKTIDKNFNDYSIIFAFDDVVFSVLEIVLVKDISEFEGFKNTQIFLSRIINDGFTIESLGNIYPILELNNYYRTLFDDARKEVKIALINAIKKNLNNLTFLLIDFEFEEIQVNKIDSIKADIEQLINALTDSDGSNAKNKKISNAENVEWFISKLKEMYDSAPKGYQMSFVHLFGIRYAKQLRNLPIKKIAFEATGKDFLHVEIGKGIKLSKYVRELENDSVD